MKLSEVLKVCLNQGKGLKMHELASIIDDVMALEANQKAQSKKPNKRTGRKFRRLERRIKRLERQLVSPKADGGLTEGDVVVIKSPCPPIEEGLVTHLTFDEMEVGQWFKRGDSEALQKINRNAYKAWLHNDKLSLYFFRGVYHDRPTNDMEFELVDAIPESLIGPDFLHVYRESNPD